MKVIIKKVSDYDYEEEVRVRSWKDFINMLRKRYNEWIITFPNKEHNYIVAKMYDSWIEE